MIPFSSEFEDVYLAIKQAAEKVNATLIDTDEFNTAEKLSNALLEADLVIADLSNSNANIMFEVGIAYSMKKPVLSICRISHSIPFDLKEFPTLVYDRKRLQETIVKPLINVLKSKNFALFITKNDEVINKKNIKTVFVSYSHEDTQYLTRLKTHLKPFEKKGLIDLWVDTKIMAGEKWKERIERALDKSAIAILLISADFLASDFITDNELPPLLKAAEEKGKLILPVILKPCRFTSNENLAKFQAVNNPKIPLSKMDDNEREEIYVKIADQIDNLVRG